MKPLLCLFAILCVLLICCPDDSSAGKKKKTKKAKKDKSSGKSGKLDSKTLKCLVCRATVDEYLWAVLKVDPKKMVDTGTWRVDKTGSQQRHVVPFGRSQAHLLEVGENVCTDNFEEYAQATWKKTGKPTIIRLQTHQGNMNPDMSKVDIAADEDLNKVLKFHCEAVIEEAEDHFVALFENDSSITDLEEAKDELIDEICVKRSEFCQASVKDEL